MLNNNITCGKDVFMPETKISKKQQACVNRYISKSYDRINLTVPKGQKEKLSAHAEARGESLNGFIKRAIEETLKRDNSEK